MYPEETYALSERRQQIHSLAIRSRFSGLSPPEQEILDKMESEELLFKNPEFYSGFFDSDHRSVFVE